MKILAIERELLGATAEAFRQHGQAEAARAWELYQQGAIRELYFRELFTTDAEVIGTNGLQPGQGEWYTSRTAARELVHGDWEG